MLSVFNGVVGCLCPIYSHTIFMYAASRSMMYSASSYDYVSDVMMCLIMWFMLIIAPLFFGIFSSLGKNK